MRNERFLRHPGSVMGWRQTVRRGRRAQVRTRMDPGFKAPNPPQDVVKMSAAYATYMASSSNLRCLLSRRLFVEHSADCDLHSARYLGPACDRTHTAGRGGGGGGGI